MPLQRMEAYPIYQLLEKPLYFFAYLAVVRDSNRSIMFDFDFDFDFSSRINASNHRFKVCIAICACLSTCASLLQASLNGFTVTTHIDNANILLIETPCTNALKIQNLTIKS